VHGSGIYIEPLRSPGAFLTVVGAHLPLLLATELGLPAIDLYTFLPWSGRIAFIVASITFVAWSAPALLRVMRADKTARFFLVGSILATLPACAVFPSGRLTIISGFGLIGVVALLGAALLERATWLPLPSERLATHLVRSFTIWSFGGHLLLSPLAMQVTLRQMVMLNGMLARLGAAIPTGPETVGQRMIIMNVPDTAFISYLPLGRRVVAGEQLPSRLLGLAAGQRTVELSRTDEQTVVVHAEGGFYRERTELLSRRADDPIPVGTHLHVGTIDIEIVETGPNGVPTTAAFHFPVSADAPDYVWMEWRGGVLVVTKPPRVGDHVTLAGQMPRLL
jgi:hypothetical protein